LYEIAAKLIIIDLYLTCIRQVDNYELEKKLLNENTCSLNSRLLDAQIIICDLQDDLVSLTVIENLAFLGGFLVCRGGSSTGSSTGSSRILLSY